MSALKRSSKLCSSSDVSGCLLGNFTNLNRWSLFGSEGPSSGTEGLVPGEAETPVLVEVPSPGEAEALALVEVPGPVEAEVPVLVKVSGPAEAEAPVPVEMSGPAEEEGMVLEGLFLNSVRNVRFLRYSSASSSSVSDSI